jgi:glucokinase
MDPVVGSHDPAVARMAVGFDIGGTKISCGIVTEDGHRVEALPPTPTPHNPAEMVALLAAAVRDVRSRHAAICTVGVGAAGLVEWPEGYIRFAPNNEYRNLPLRKLLEDAVDLPTFVDNDANVAALAEARLGDTPAHMMFLTIGTGVGAGLVLGGELYRGGNGIGGEVGHLVVDPNGETRCGCGNIGCLEAVASGTALARYGQEAAGMDGDGEILRLAGSPTAVTGEVILKAALMGDPVAQSIYERVGAWLGVGIASLTNVLDLQQVVIGGGVAAAGEMLLRPIRASLDRYLFARDHRTRPQICLAVQGVDAGWMGAALLALESTGPASARAPEGTTGTHAGSLVGAPTR